MMDIPPPHNWLSIGALFAVVTGIVGGTISWVSLPNTLPQWGRWILAILVAILAIFALINAAFQDRDSEALTQAAKDQSPRFAEISNKLDRLTKGLGIPDGGTIDDRLDRALAAAAAQKSSHIDDRLHPTPRGQDAHIGAPATGKPSKIQQPAVSSEVERGALLSQLSQLYILNHDGISSEMLAGLEVPPVAWLNAELIKRGADWRVSTCKGAKCQTVSAP